MTESRQDDVRQSLLATYADELHDWAEVLGSEVLDGDDFESARKRNYLEAVRVLDPMASLREELQVSLHAPGLDQGAIGVDATSILFKPLQESVSKLAGAEVEMELVGVSSGSTVLHFRPKHADDQDESDDDGAIDGPVDFTRSEAALRSFVQLVDAAEREGDLRKWAGATEAFGKFAKALDKLDARADIAWHGVSGDVRSARLGQTARDYVRSLLATRTRSEPRPISGRVTELREAGVVKVKTGVSRTSAAYDVRFEPNDLLGLHLALGDRVSFLVSADEQVDSLGNVQSVEYYFLRVLPAP